MAWMPLEPVPMRPTRLPARSTPSRGHFDVWMIVPVKVSRPGMSGRLVADRQPTAVTSQRQLTRSPCSVSTIQRLASSSKCADVTRVDSWMSLRMSKRSATWFRYRSISGCSG